MKQKFYSSALCCLLFFFSMNSFAQNIWTAKHDFDGNERHSAVAFSIGSKGYLGTGHATSDYSDFWEYDPSTDSWNQKTSFTGSARSRAVGFSVGSKGYIGLGFAGTTALSDLYEYDPSSNSWSAKTSFPGSARGEAIALNIGTKAYVGLGGTKSGTTYNDFYEYNPSTDSWATKTNYPGSARTGCAGFTIGSKGYVGTGQDLVYDDYRSFYSEFYEYNPSTDAWTAKTSFPGDERDYAVGFSIGQKGYIGSGKQQYSPSGYVYFGDFFEYEPALDTWNAVQGIGYSVFGAAAFSIGSKGYVATGRSSGGVNYKKLSEYSPLRVITGSLSSTSYCSGSSVSVPFTTSNITFNSGNVFTAQLSDASGSFASPTNIGTLTSTSSSGTISSTIPSNVATGYNYRIRVVSSNEASVGSNNGTNLTIMGSDFPWSGSVWTSRDQSIILVDDRQDWNYICENSDVYFNAGAASPSDYSIYASTLSNTPYWDPSSGTMTFTMEPGHWVVFSVNVTVNGCPKTLHYTFFPMNCDYSMYSLAPNPTTSDLVIYVDDEKLKKQKIAKSPEQVIQQVIITDKLGNVLRQQKYSTNTKKISLNVSGLTPDIYIAKVFNGKKWTIIKFIKK